MGAIAEGLRRANRAKLLSANSARFVGLMMALIHTLLMSRGLQRDYDAYYAGGVDEPFLFHDLGFVIIEPLPTFAAFLLRDLMIPRSNLNAISWNVYSDVLILTVAAFYWFVTGYFATRLTGRFWAMNASRRLAWALIVPTVLFTAGFLLTPGMARWEFAWYPVWYGPPLLILLGLANSIPSRVQAAQPIP